MKKLIAVLSIIALSVSLCGCELISEFAIGISSEISEKIEIETAVVRVGFADSGDEDYTDTLFVDTCDLACYASEFSSYSSSYFLNLLTEDEKIIYHAMEYAFDNCYEQIIIDERICPNTENLDRILLYLSMDSPLVEQNLKYSLYSLSFSFPLDSENLNIYIPFNGYSIEIANFCDELYEKKLIAIDKAKEILATVPANFSITQTAEYLYEYIAQNIVYEGYNDDELHPYLHDALVLNRSHCDGTSNALSLLYNLSGIPCFEKISPPYEESAGHTWNCAMLDDTWYNFDATIDPDDFQSVGCYFAFSDDLVDIIPNYQDLMPQCNNGLYMNSSGHFQSESSEGVYEAFYSTIIENGTYCLVTFDSFDYDKCSPILKNLVNEANVSITTSYYSGTNKTVFLIECT